MSLATAVNNQIRNVAINNGSRDGTVTPPTTRSKRQVHTEKDPLKALAHRVSIRIEQGDFRGAVHLAVSEEVIADNSRETLIALQQKHPPFHPDSVILLLPDELEHDGEMSESMVMCALKSFPCWSAGGPDCLRPQHIKDTTGFSAGESGSFLLKSLTSFVNLVLSGGILESVRPFCFGVNLVGGWWSAPNSCWLYSSLTGGKVCWSFY